LRFRDERGRFRGREVLETAITSPRMIPQIVLALALLVFFEAVGLAESFAGLVISHLLVTIPFAFRTLLVSVATLCRRLEWSSDFLGATPTQNLPAGHRASAEDRPYRVPNLRLHPLLQQRDARAIPVGIRRADAARGDVPTCPRQAPP
jgi:hypothetical protein